MVSQEIILLPIKGKNMFLKKVGIMVMEDMLFVVTTITNGMNQFLITLILVRKDYPKFVPKLLMNVEKEVLKRRKRAKNTGQLILHCIRTIIV